MAVEASGERPALEQFTDYLSGGGDRLSWNEHTGKIHEIFQARIGHLNEDVQSLVEECDKKEFQAQLKKMDVDPSQLVAYVEGILVLKTSTGNKVTNVAKSNVLAECFAFDSDHGTPWSIQHLSKENQDRLVAFFDSGATPTDLTDDEWVELVREADKLDIPDLFEGLVEAKIPYSPKSLGETIKLYKLMCKTGVSSGNANILSVHLVAYGRNIINAALAGETVEDSVLKEITFFEFPRSGDFSASIELLKKCPNATFIVAEGLNQEQINLLAKSAPQCVQLVAREGTFETLPEFAHLISLKCTKCENLTKLSLPQATEVVCGHCPALTKLSLLQATRVICDYCSALTELSLPQATEVFCDYCSALTKLSLPEATWVDCGYCPALTKLSLPKATNVVCSECPALTKLSLPKATYVVCSECPALTKLSLPQATSVDCYKCSALTNLSLPRATSVVCGQCPALTYFLAPEPAKLLYGDAQAGIITAARLRASEGPPPEGLL